MGKSTPLDLHYITNSHNVSYVFILEHENKNKVERSYYAPINAGKDKKNNNLIL